MKAVVEGKFVAAERAGKYIRGEFIAGGVNRFYINADEDTEAADGVMSLSELEQFTADVDVFVNTPRGGGPPYLSVRLRGLRKRARAASA